MPASQLVQAVDRVEPAYLPAAQSVQDEAPKPEYFPVPQVEQYVEAVASDALPAEQAVQVDAPDEEYFPIAQSGQDEDFVRATAFPAAQLSHELTPPKEKVPARQSVHPIDAEVPIDLVPSRQLTHVDWAINELYDPPGQAVQEITTPP